MFSDPAKFYTVVNRFEGNELGSLYLVERLSDKEKFVMKVTNANSVAEKQVVINTIKVVRELNCEQILGCVEAFERYGKIFVILEMMSGGSLDSIIKKSP